MRTGAEYRSVTRRGLPRAAVRRRRVRGRGPRLGRDRVPVMRRPPGPVGPRPRAGRPAALGGRAVVRRPGAGAGLPGNSHAAAVLDGPAPRRRRRGDHQGRRRSGLPEPEARGSARSWASRPRPCGAGCVACAPAPATCARMPRRRSVLPRAVTGPTSTRAGSLSAIPWPRSSRAHGPRSPAWLRRGGPRRPPRPLRHRRRPRAGTRQLTARSRPGHPHALTRTRQHTPGTSWIPAPRHRRMTTVDTPSTPPGGIRNAHALCSSTVTPPRLSYVRQRRQARPDRPALPAPAPVDIGLPAFARTAEDSHTLPHLHQGPLMTLPALATALAPKPRASTTSKPPPNCSSATSRSCIETTSPGDSSAGAPASLTASPRWPR